MKNKKNIKQSILDSIEFARQELKYVLVSDEWGSDSRKCACALGCVIAKDNPDNLFSDGDFCYQKIQTILGVDEDWVGSFTEGFDGNGYSEGSKVPEAWDLGREIAKETKPIEYHKWDGEYHG